MIIVALAALLIGAITGFAAAANLTGRAIAAAAIRHTHGNEQAAKDWIHQHFGGQP